MMEDIPREQWGWWKDICPGRTLILREATKEDLERCILDDKASHDNKDYMCELSRHGALVNKIAIEYYHALITKI